LRGWDLIDLDSHFLSAFGSIGQFIRDHGYLAYASANVALYQRLAADAPASAVCALSSGFMLYPDALGEHYRALRKTIETDPLTALLLPSFALEQCVAQIVERQLQRAYLMPDRAREEQKIRKRFPLFMQLQSRRFLSDGRPAEAVAVEILDTLSDSRHSLR